MRRPHSNSAPTIIWSRRSACASSSRACVRCCADLVSAPTRCQPDVAAACCPRSARHRSGAAARQRRRARRQAHRARVPAAVHACGARRRGLRSRGVAIGSLGAADVRHDSQRRRAREARQSPARCRGAAARLSRHRTRRRATSSTTRRRARKSRTASSAAPAAPSASRCISRRRSRTSSCSRLPTASAPSNRCRT